MDEIRRPTCAGMSARRDLQAAYASELARKTGKAVTVTPSTFRPPMKPVTMGSLAEPGRRSRNEKNVSTVIGGGVAGAATAYNLLKQGMRDVVLSRKIPCSGSTGRCGAGARERGSEGNCKLAQLR